MLLWMQERDANESSDDDQEDDRPTCDIIESLELKTFWDLFVSKDMLNNAVTSQSLIAVVFFWPSMSHKSTALITLVDDQNNEHK